MDVKLKDIVIKIFSLLLTICAYATKNADEGFAGRLSKCMILDPLDNPI